ncbi:hypothetical protein PUV54_07715 [Hyphococcus flavus]|uniref:DoxX family protein n=1 Tax=Hyphococcus flavus TaxID=1866326 RepID=A0AAE9ZL05_9PROT|nr:hypothetical protein [Hyphococcus flavus]WDI33081.1 hypothetical protein PUV54_07715 [Hyphococcus flavus]
MKAGLLFALRTSTGLLLIIWGVLRVMSTDTAVRLSETYYSGMLSTEALILPLAYGQIILGALVILGLFRVIIYPLQALVLVGGAVAIWKFLADPLGLYLLTEETRKILFFPSTTVAVASLIIIAFKEYDAFSLDRMFSRR